MQAEVARIVNPFLEAADGALPSGTSVLLYGSAARGEYVPGRSDVNLMVVPAKVDAAFLAALAGSLRDWELERQPPPLLLSREELARGTDVFPIEITDIRAAYQVLRGKDPVAGLTVRPADLRRALEGELRGKLLRLRQAYVAFRDKPGMLGVTAQGSIAVVLVLFRAVLALVGRDVPDTGDATIREAAKALGVDGDLLRDVLRHRAEADWPLTAIRFEEYMAALERAVRTIDDLQPGESS